MKRYDVLPKVGEFIKDQEINQVAANLSMDFRSVNETMNSINLQDGFNLNQSLQPDQKKTVSRQKTKIITSVTNSATNSTNALQPQQ